MYLCNEVLGSRCYSAEIFSFSFKCHIFWEKKSRPVCPITQAQLISSLSKKKKHVFAECVLYNIARLMLNVLLALAWKKDGVFPLHVFWQSAYATLVSLYTYYSPKAKALIYTCQNADKLLAFQEAKTCSLIWLELKECNIRGCPTMGTFLGINYDLQMGYNSRKRLQFMDYVKG